MRQIRARHVLQGIAICAAGAFIWELFYFRAIYEGGNKFLVIVFSAFFGLLMASIYLVPLGAALGVALPPVALNKPLTVCVLTGLVAGVVIAGLTSLIVTVAFELRLRAAFLSMTPVCSLLVLGWMLLLRLRHETTERSLTDQPSRKDGNNIPL